MSPIGQKANSQPRRRRYVLHLSCDTGDGHKPCQYIARIRPLGTRPARQAEVNEHFFPDERALIATINPLLPSGSDVRDVFSHVESPDGFFYILCLSGEEARLLGWLG